MTKEFENLLNLLKSGISENIMLGLQIAQNYKSEFEAYFGCLVEEYEEMYYFCRVYNVEIEGFVTDLIRLNISNKKLKEIPKSIKILKKLERLYLYNNNITELPKEIGELTNLNMINLDGNNLIKFPKEIEKLANLKALYMSELKNFSKEIETINKINPSLRIETLAF